MIAKLRLLPVENEIIGVTCGMFEDDANNTMKAIELLTAKFIKQQLIDETYSPSDVMFAKTSNDEINQFLPSELIVSLAISMDGNERLDFIFDLRTAVEDVILSHVDANGIYKDRTNALGQIADSLSDLSEMIRGAMAITPK